ncbi:hypothetical protein HDE_07699 [Halotydeus destructor]|nr:hypothetical protein HDE_07699 [Halotydeus destructor]
MAINLSMLNFTNGRQLDGVKNKVIANAFNVLFGLAALWTVHNLVLHRLKVRFTVDSEPLEAGSNLLRAINLIVSLIGGYTACYIGSKISQSLEDAIVRCVRSRFEFQPLDGTEVAEGQHRPSAEDLADTVGNFGEEPEVSPSLSVTKTASKETVRTISPTNSLASDVTMRSELNIGDTDTFEPMKCPTHAH